MQHVTILESAIEKRVVRDAKKLGIKIALKLESRSEIGFPDRLFLIPGGSPTFIEFKRPGESPRALQRHRLSQLTKLGYDAVWFDNYADAMGHLAHKVSATSRPETRD